MLGDGRRGDGEPRFIDAGECALVVEFGNAIEPDINDRVLALDAALCGVALDGIEEVVPTYRSVLIHFDPLVATRDALAARVRDLLVDPPRRRLGRRIIFPACYDAEFGVDLAEVAFALSLSEAEVVRLHAAGRYRVYMHGFAPGMPYLGGLPEALRLARRLTPRAAVPADSLLIAAGQATIASLEMPSGWHIIGRTPEHIFVPEREQPFLLRTGDEVGFEPVDAVAFAALAARATAGEPVARVEAMA